MTRGRSVRSGFEQRLLSNLRSSDISGKRAIIGFSGGPDSLALAAASQRVAKPLGMMLLLVHIDHRLRPTSHLDAEHCRALAAELDLPFECVPLTEGLVARAPGVGLEEQARRERYRALSDVARTWNSRTIMLAHQANDQAETVLLHLFRGSGSIGLAGMQMRENRLIPWWPQTQTEPESFDIVRPLLNEPRSMIERYIAERGLSPVIDETNTGDVFDRNWIRNRVLPTIEMRWPAASTVIARSAAATHLDEIFLEKQVAAIEATRDTNDRSICTDTLTEQDPALAFRLIRNWLLRIGLEEIDFDVVARIYALVLGGSENQLLEIGSNQSAVIAHGHLMTIDDLRDRTFEQYPVDFTSGNRHWSIFLDPDKYKTTYEFRIPDDGQTVIRSLQPGDRWYGTNRPVFEDVRLADIHPLIRTSLLAVVGRKNGVLLIPAIYPTIRSDLSGVTSTRAGVQWQITH